MIYTGWVPDVPDHRDLLAASSPNILRDAGPMSAQFDNRSLCSSIEDQGELGSCTAHAGVGALEFYEKSHKGKYSNYSRLFLYKKTRDLSNLKGDTGASLRQTMKAMAKFGICREKLWPYRVSTFENAPSSVQLADAALHQALKYYKLDQPDKNLFLMNIKRSISNGNSAVIGFSCFNEAFAGAEDEGIIKFPEKSDKFAGGHAVLIVGYTKDSLIIKNSWGRWWGDHGYGYLSNDYVLKGLAQDCWTLEEAE